MLIANTGRDKLVWSATSGAHLLSMYVLGRRLVSRDILWDRACRALMLATRCKKTEAAVWAGSQLAAGVASVGAAVDSTRQVHRTKA